MILHDFPEQHAVVYVSGSVFSECLNDHILTNSGQHAREPNPLQLLSSHEYAEQSVLHARRKAANVDTEKQLECFPRITFNLSMGLPQDLR
jgi:hypothetical protein